jgi:hypothetical protein
MAEQAQFLPIKLPLGTTSDSHTLSAAYSDSVSISRCLGLLQTLSSYVRPYLRYKRDRPSAGPSGKSVPTEFQYYMGISGYIYLWLFMLQLQSSTSIINYH